MNANETKEENCPLLNPDSCSEACLRIRLIDLAYLIFSLIFFLNSYWMPNKKWKNCNVKDPSARVLPNYGKSGN